MVGQTPKEVMRRECTPINFAIYAWQVNKKVLNTRLRDFKGRLWA
jgi:hypothetical protein